jgi:hypothetical protein
MLETDLAVEEQARRMVADPRAREVVSDYHNQWLDFRRVPSLIKDDSLFSDYNETIAADMHTEAMTLIEEVLFGGASNYMGLFTARHTFVNQNLASFYGLQGGFGVDFTRADFAADQRRAGVFTLGGTMSLGAKPNQADPIQRGKLIRNQVLCDPPPPPPSGLIIVPPELNDSMTTRERFAAHRDTPACEGCHRLLDPIGFVFENFDAVGRYRDTENGLPVDTTGEVVDSDIAAPIDGATELGSALAQSAQVQACVAMNWFRYAAGRAEVAADACSLDELEARFSQSDFSMSELLVALTQTEAFLYRRGGL